MPRMAYAGKWAAAVTEIKMYSKQGRPVLVGTTSVERSEALAAMLKQEGASSSGALSCGAMHRLSTHWDPAGPFAAVKTRAPYV